MKPQIVLSKMGDFVLIGHLRQQEEQVFNELFDRYFKRLFSFAHNLLGDVEVAKELAMDVMLRLWQKRENLSLNEGETLLPYLFRSIRNAVINHMRKATILTFPISSQEDLEILSSQSADSNLYLQELEQAYEQALAALPTQRRKIFLMSREEYLTYAEIAERLGISIHTVRNQMSASIDFLRRRILENPREFDPILTLIFICGGYVA